MIVTPRCFSAEVLRRRLRTFITSNVIWIKILFPLIVVTCPYTLFAATASTKNSPLEIAVQPMVGRHVQNIQNRSSTRAPQSSNQTDLPNSQCADVSCCIPVNISSTDFCHLGFRLSRALAFALRFVRLLVPTIRYFVSILSSFDIHHRIVSVLLSFLRNLCLSGFLFLSCHPSPLPDFSLPFPFRETASTSIESSSCVFPAEVVMKRRLLLK